MAEFPQSRACVSPPPNDRQEREEKVTFTSIMLGSKRFKIGGEAQETSPSVSQTYSSALPTRMIDWIHVAESLTLCGMRSLAFGLWSTESLTIPKT